MTKHIRFSLDLNALPTIPDTDPMVKYGVIENETVFETNPFSAARTGASHRLSEVRLLPPCWPSKIICVGRNYVDHAKELGDSVPDEPLIFLKPPSSVIADGDEIVYPSISEMISYEGELGLVVGTRSRHVKPEDAMDIIFGYTCVDDITARDLQRKDDQWARAKGFDTFCPVGPWITPRDEFDLDGTRIRTFVDGEKKQDAPAGDMVFSVVDVITFVTQFLTLEPGDLIATGTPPGVGSVLPGAEIRVEVDGVGVLRNKLIKEKKV